MCRESLSTSRPLESTVLTLSLSLPLISRLTECRVLNSEFYRPLGKHPLFSDCMHSATRSTPLRVQAVDSLEAKTNGQVWAVCRLHPNVRSTDWVQCPLCPPMACLIVALFFSALGCPEWSSDHLLHCWRALFTQTFNLHLKCFILFYLLIKYIWIMVALIGGNSHQITAQSGHIRPHLGFMVTQSGGHRRQRRLAASSFRMQIAL